MCGITPLAEKGMIARLCITNVLQLCHHSSWAPRKLSPFHFLRHSLSHPIILRHSLLLSQTSHHTYFKTYKYTHKQNRNTPAIVRSRFPPTNALFPPTMALFPPISLHVNAVLFYISEPLSFAHFATVNLHTFLREVYNYGETVKFKILLLRTTASTIVPNLGYTQLTLSLPFHA